LTEYCIYDLLLTMSSPEDLEIRDLINDAFEEVDTEEIDRQFDELNELNEKIVFDNFGTLINLVDYSQMKKVRPNRFQGSMYVDSADGRILAAGAHHTIDQELVYVDGALELELRVVFSGDRPLFGYDLESEELSDIAMLNLMATKWRCNSFDPTS
jgi:hypothetical protein